MVQILPSNTFGVAKWVVSADPTQGTHTTIGAALTAASSGDTIFIRDGTYTENLTLKAGVCLSAFECDAPNPNVTIIGKATFTAAGTVSISGIQLQTNSDFFLAVTGSSVSIVYLENCYLNCSNNTGISHTVAAASIIYVLYCQGVIATTGISLFASSSTGSIHIEHTTISNTGGSGTASTMSAGSLYLSYSRIEIPITISGTTAGLQLFQAILLGTLTYNSTNAGGGTVLLSYIAASATSAISVGAGATLSVENCVISTSNTNAITGSGIIQYSDLIFTGNSSTINTTTQTAQILKPGIVLNNKQPLFYSYLNTIATNATGDGTAYTVGFNATLYDQNSNFNTSTFTFTAPYTGTYHFDFGILGQGLIAASTPSVSLVTTARTYNWGNNAGAFIGNNQFSSSWNVQMTAADTATLLFTVGGGSKTVSVYGSTAADSGRTFLSGYLIG